MHTPRPASGPVVSAFVAALCALLGGGAAGQHIEFERAAKSFATTHALAAQTPDKIVYADVLQQAFVRVRLGAFEVYYPRTGLTKRSEDLKGTAQALVDVQLMLLDWVKPAGKDQKPAREDLAAVQAWVRSWKVPALVKLAGEKGSELPELLAANEATRAALERLATSLQRAEPFGVAREAARPVRLVLLPTRKDFVELIALLGWIAPDQRGNFWQDGVADWSQSFNGDDQLIALEYAAPNHPPGEYEQGLDMGKESNGIMQQQVVQLGLNSFFDQLYEERLPAAFCQGLSMNLVIDHFGEINTRVDGDLRPRSAAKREVFVPGGDKDGGRLAKNSAETRWRQERGKDHWIKLLRQTQREGEELERGSKQRQALFGVLSDDGGKHQLVQAPFLGSAAASATPPPAEFQGDFAEFRRAYKSAFIYWLETKAAGSEKASREAFARTLARFADPKLQGDFEVLFGEQYEKKPLSGATADKENLEGQFLLWLQKQK